MRFYTNVCRIGNNICTREWSSTGPSKYKSKYCPTLYLQTDAESESNFKTLYSDHAAEFPQDSMSAAREFMQKMDGVSGLTVFGQQNWILQYINQTYPEVIKFDGSKISAWVVDLESKLPTDDSGNITGFPDVDEANAEITLISMKHLTDGRCFTFGSKEYTGEEPLTSKYMNCGSESELLRQFVNFWSNQAVEVVTGWNIERFDIPFIVNRIKKVIGDSYVRRLSPWDTVESKKKAVTGNFGKESTIIDIMGVSVLDYFALYKKFVFVKHESYSLGHIAQEELGHTKLDHSEFSNFNEFYEKGFNKFLQYNIIDVDLVAQLEDKLKLIDLVYTVAFLAKINFTDVFSPVKTWDSIIHNRLFSSNIVIPLREHNPDADKSIEGAYVKEPVPGMYEWITTLDATSLYPSIMMTLNISPETYLGIDKSYDIESVLNGDKILPLIDTVCVGPNGTKFDKTSRGVIPSIVEEYMVDRKTAKKKMLSKEQELEHIKAEMTKRNIAIN